MAICHSAIPLDNNDNLSFEMFAICYTTIFGKFDASATNAFFKSEPMPFVTLGSATGSTIIFCLS